MRWGQSERQRHRETEVKTDRQKQRDGERETETNRQTDAERDRRPERRSYHYSGQECTRSRTSVVP